MKFDDNFGVNVDGEWFRVEVGFEGIDVKDKVGRFNFFLDGRKRVGIGVIIFVEWVMFVY